MINIKLSAAAAQLNCSLPTSDDLAFQGISTDTRQIKQGNLYVAIRGERYDGHDFVHEAMEKGAVAALVDRPIATSIPQLQVPDTLEAFGKLSHYWRRQFSLPVIGITGSNGKTTLKNMVASILRAHCQQDESQVLATQGNLNNNIGVPIMLSRLNQNHQYAVIEMGMNHFGEIEYLTKLAQPHIAVINNAAAAHLEGVNDVAGVARAKGEIFLGLAQSGTAILNRDDNFFQYWQTLVSKHHQLTFGLNHPADVTADIQDKHILLKTSVGEIAITLPLLGRHNVQNALAATAIAIALNIPLNTIKRGLEQVQPAPGRMRQYELKEGVRIIDDTYNANPFSLQAAIHTLAAFTGKRILVVGDMKELGPDAKQHHYAAGETIKAAGIDHLYTLGEMSAYTAEAFGTDAKHFMEHDQLVSALKNELTQDTVVLIKGSRSMRMEKIVGAIVPIEHSH